MAINLFPSVICFIIIFLSVASQVEEKMALERYAVEDSISRAPEILVRLRSHTVWEKMAVKLFFTVQGFPTPVVQW